MITPYRRHAVQSTSRIPRCLTQSADRFLDRLVGLQHAVKLSRLENQAYLFTRAGDSQVAGTLAYALQAADQRTETGTVHELHQIEIYDNPDLAVGGELGEPLTHRLRRAH